LQRVSASLEVFLDKEYLNSIDPSTEKNVFQFEKNDLKSF